MTQHLGLAQRQPPALPPRPRPTVEQGAKLLHVSLSAEQTGVVRHVEAGAEAELPRITVFGAVANQHRVTSIHAESDVGIPAAEEDRTRAGIGIQCPKFLVRQRYPTAGVHGLSDRQCAK